MGNTNQPEDNQEKMRELQMQEQIIQQILMQKQSAEAEISETDSILKEIERTNEDIYKIVGQLMIKTEQSKIKEEMNERKKRLECLETLLILFEIVKGMSLNGAQTAYFEETGRICNPIALINSLKDAVSNFLVDDNDAEKLGAMILQAIPPEFNAQVTLQVIV
jgi:chaperonin cofactor prefoldin